jgi:drug/metabolite transporter (DMT)-like permease
MIPQILAMGAAETYGNYNLKNYAFSNNKYQLFKGLFAWSLVLYLLVMSFRNHNMMHVSMMWEFSITLFTVLTAYFVMGERFTDWKQWLGVLIIFMGAWLIHYGGTHTTIRT